MSIFSFHFSFLNSFQIFIQEMDFHCKRNGVKKGFSQVMYSSVIEGVSLFLIVWSVYLYLKPSSPLWIGILIAAGIIPFIVNMVWQELKFEQRIRKIEYQLPDSLILFASLPNQTTFEEAIEMLSNSTPIPIREEWKIVKQCMHKSGNVKSALEKFGGGMHSNVISRSKHLLQRGYESGISIHAAAASLAHDLLLHQSFFQERNATLLVEKYTLLAAGGVLVPILLGVMVGVVQQMPFTLLQENAAAHQQLFQAALFSIRGYLGIYATLAGIFIGLQENRKWKMSVYVLVLIPLAQLSYQIGKWWV